jgi:general secretion pathway protein M
MMQAIVGYWNQRSARERWMLGVMLALLAGVVLWLGVVRPIEAARKDSRTALREATERHAAIAERVKLLKRLPPVAPVTGAAPIDQIVGQGAGEAGLTLARAQAQGSDRIDIAIADVRPIALMSWFAALEGQGVRVETMSARPSATAGSIAVEALLVRETAQ